MNSSREIMPSWLVSIIFMWSASIIFMSSAASAEAPAKANEAAKRIEIGLFMFAP